MPLMKTKDRLKISHELKKMGFGGIEDVNLFAQIAVLYQNHNSFRGLLMSTAPDQRQIAYDALRPHLRFTPKPLDVYEREIKEKAEREQWDTFDGSAYPKAFKTPTLTEMAENAIRENVFEAKGGLEAVCAHCLTTKVFRGRNRKEAEKDFHSEGWRTDGCKDYCPQHIPSRLTTKLTCSNEECGRRQDIRAWDEQDGYTKARLAGWVIEDSAICPECSAKKLIQ
ncbi:MAG TPA: hypothetical protein VGG46_04020 [Terriglobales bacterium]|jgi:hypothetical protein